MFGDTNKGGIGMLNGTCGICGEGNIVVAMAHYDFGISPQMVALIRAFCADMRQKNKGKWMML